MEACFPLFFLAGSGQGQIHILLDIKKKKKNPSCVLGNQLSLQSFICSSLDSEILMKPEYKVLIRIHIYALGQHAVRAVFYLCVGWGIRLVSGFLTDPMTSDEGKYFELVEKLQERNKDVAQTCTTSPFPFHQCHMSILQLSCHCSTVKTQVPFTWVTCHFEYPPSPRHSLDSCVTV